MTPAQSLRERVLLLVLVGVLLLGAGAAALGLVRHGEYAIPYAVRAPKTQDSWGGRTVQVEGGVIRPPGPGGGDSTVWATRPEFSVTVTGEGERPVEVANALRMSDYEAPRGDVRASGTRLRLSSPGTYRFRPAARESYTVMVMGDPQGYPENLAQALRLEPQALFALCLGDLVVDGREDQFREIETVADESPLPVYFTIGNHDTMNGGRKFYRALFGEETYAFHVGSDLFAVLDTAADHTYLGDDRLAWLDRVLSAPGTRHRLAFTHMPPLDPRPGRNHGLDWRPLRDGLARILGERRVPVAFTGHVHDYLEGDLGRVHYVISAGLAPDDESRYPAHAARVRVSPAGVAWERVDLGPGAPPPSPE